MKTLNFFAKKKDFASVNRLIRKRTIKRFWYFWGKAELVYFEVGGNNKHIARFKEESRYLRVAKPRGDE